MSIEPYNDAVRALFADPVHTGSLDSALQARIDEKDLRIEFSAAMRGELIENLRFRAWGCPHVIAAAEWLCAHCEGRPGSSLENVAAAELMQSLAVPVEKSGRILVIEDAARLLGAAIREASSS